MALPLAAFAAASELPLQELGRPFAPPVELPVEWKVPKSSLPQQVSIYKTASNPFSPRARSYLLSLGGWTLAQQTNPPGRPVVPEHLFFDSENGARTLSIYPPHGIIEYRNEKARATMGERAHNVPTEEEVLKLGREVLKNLEINERDVAKDTNGALRVSRGRRVRGQHGIEQVISRDVYFVREVDGIRFSGLGTEGGVMLAFGDSGKVAELSVVWPRLEPLKTVAVATPQQIVEYIRRGKTAITYNISTDEILANLSKIRRITVHGISPFYLGSSMDDPKEYIRPYAALEITAEFSHTNLSAVVNGPIVEDVRK